MKSKRSQNLVRKGLDDGLVSLAPPERRLIGVASTGTRDREGDVVEPSGWILDSYLANPVMLWCHDYSQPPLAKGTRVWVEADQLRFEAQFPPEGTYPLADLVYALYQGGYLNGFSAGFGGVQTEPIVTDGLVTGTHYQRQELYEISCAPVPVNAQAMAQAVKSFSNFEQPNGDDDMNWLEKLKSVLGLGPEADEAAVLAALEAQSGNWQTCAKALGLGPQAQREAVSKALEARKPSTSAILPGAVTTELGLAAGAGESEIVGAIKGLKRGRDQAQDLAQKVAALEQANSARQATEAVEKALTAGKIAPAQKDWASEYAQKDLAGFQAYVAAAPQVVPVEALPGVTKSATTAGVLDEVQKSINHMLGIPDEVFSKHFPNGKEA